MRVLRPCDRKSYKLIVPLRPTLTASKGRKKFFSNSNDPENVPIPDLQEKINADQIMDCISKIVVDQRREDRADN